MATSIKDVNEICSWQQLDITSSNWDWNFIIHNYSRRNQCCHESLESFSYGATDTKAKVVIKPGHLLPHHICALLCSLGYWWGRGSQKNMLQKAAGYNWETLVRCKHVGPVATKRSAWPLASAKLLKLQVLRRKRIRRAKEMVEIWLQSAESKFGVIVEEQPERRVALS